MPRPGSAVVPRGVVAMARTVSRGAMVDRCVVERHTEPGDFDPDTGLHDPPGGWAEVTQPAGVTEPDGLPCRIHPAETMGRRVVVADADAMVGRVEGRLPVGADVDMDDRIRVTAVHPTHGDPAQQDAVYRVVDPEPRAYPSETVVALESVDE